MSRSAGAGPFERLGELGWKRRGDVDPLLCERVLEREAAGVQELALEPEVAADAVDRVARDGQADRRQVHPDLVRAPRLQPHAEQRVTWQQLLHLEVRDRLAWNVRV